jgi:hypothetical protein
MVAFVTLSDIVITTGNRDPASTLATHLMDQDFNGDVVVGTPMIVEQ